MSDLQCPATFLFLSAEDGPAAAALAGLRVALVYDAQHAVASEAATTLAGHLDVAARALDEPVTAEAVLARAPAAMRVLRDVADLHRGETVAVLTDTREPFLVEVDADGVRSTPLGHLDGRLGGGG